MMREVIVLKDEPISETPDFRKVSELRRWLIDVLDADNVLFETVEGGSETANSLNIHVKGVSLNDNGMRIVKSIHTWDVEGYVTVRFEVYLSVEGPSESEAADVAKDMLGNLSHATACGSGADWEAEDWGHGVLEFDVTDVKVR